MKNEKIIEKSTSIRGLDPTHSEGSKQFGIAKQLFTGQAGANIETLYTAIKYSPEIVACLNAIVEDIMSDGWKYIGKTDGAIQKAKKFGLQSKIFKVLSNALWELIGTGNAYILKLSVNEDNIKSIIKDLETEMFKALSIAKPSKRKEILFEIVSQNLTKPVDLQLLKSSTIKINYDKTGQIKSFQQDVGGVQRVYSPKDVIHLTLINIGGQPYGFTPLETLLSDVATLIFAKNFVGKYFENDGVPNFIFSMEEEYPDSPAYKKLKQELKDLKEQGQKFRNLVITGKVKAEQLQKFNKDMEFSKLIQHFTQVVLIGLGVPTYRINYTLADKQVGSDINRAFEGYYKKINFIQRIVEETLNAELFSHFSVEIKFNMTYKVDEMREAQIMQILAQIGAITIPEIRERLGFDPEIPEGAMMPVRTGSDVSIDFGADKRTQQGQDNNPQSPDKNTDNRLKTGNK